MTLVYAGDESRTGFGRPRNVARVQRVRSQTGPTLRLLRFLWPTKQNARDSHRGREMAFGIVGGDCFRGRAR